VLVPVNGKEAVFGLQQVSYRYLNRLTALEALSLDLEEGGLYAVIGANGSGKSTLLQLLAGLIHPSAGQVCFLGKEISESTLADPPFLRRFRGAVGYLFQHPEVQLFCPTVLDEMLFGPLQLGLGAVEAGRRTQEVMDLLGLAPLAQRPSYMLSGGEKKKAALGAILTMNPEVLLLDEPTNGLDPRTQFALTELVTRLHRAGKTVVLSTHDLQLVGRLQPQVVVLSEDHRLAHLGPAAAILADTDLLARVNLIHRPA